MSAESIEIIRGYAAFFFTMFLAIVFVAYVIYLYTAKKKSGRDFEKYGNMALDDELSSPPVDPVKRDLSV